MAGVFAGVTSEGAASGAPTKTERNAKVARNMLSLAMAGCASCSDRIASFVFGAVSFDGAGAEN
jgi:hypothetical protein